jgi:hypothetical protein
MKHLNNFQLNYIYESCYWQMTDGKFISHHHQKLEEDLFEKLNAEIINRGFKDAEDLKKQIGDPFSDKHYNAH